MKIEFNCCYLGRDKDDNIATGKGELARSPAGHPHPVQVQPKQFNMPQWHYKTWKPCNLIDIWKSSFVDPDPNPYPDQDWIRIQWGPRFAIRIWIQKGKNNPQKLKKVKKFHFFKCWMFSLRSKVFSCNLDVLFGGLRIEANCNFLSQKDRQKFSAVFFS